VDHVNVDDLEYDRKVEARPAAPAGATDAADPSDAEKP